MYASKSEASYARYLDLCVKAGTVKSWEGQYRVPLVVNGEKVCTIVPDFRVHFPDGTLALVEVKGHATPIWKLKVKLFRALHQNTDYRVIPAREALAL